MNPSSDTWDRAQEALAYADSRVAGSMSLEKGGIAEKADLSSHLLSCIHLTWQKEAINEQEIYVKTCELFSRVGD
jgi:hypothetical protein